MKFTDKQLKFGENNNTYLGKTLRFCIFIAYYQLVISVLSVPKRLTVCLLIGNLQEKMGLEMTMGICKIMNNIG